MFYLLDSILSFGPVLSALVIQLFWQPLQIDGGHFLLTFLATHK
jgi:hypothetical protein